MMSRVGLVTGASCAVAGWQANKVHAASEPDKKTKIRPSELPIYDEPEPVELEVVPEWDSSFHKKVSATRKWTWSYLDSIQDSTNQVKDKYEIAKAHASGTLTYIHDDQSVVARAAIITVSGLGGIVAGYKGGAIRKTLYAATALAAASSICYPQQALTVGKEGYHLAADFASTTYNDLFDSTGSKKPATKMTQQSKKPETEEKPAAKNPNSLKMDFGMSKPEDKDMYTTRGS
jgi:hypothetical protein